VVTDGFPGAGGTGAASTGDTRIRLDLAYDGTDFHGWSKQPGLRTVQGVLEDALATAFSRHGEPPRLTVAGRTDAGVHATGQVAHLDLNRDQLASLAPRRGSRTASADALARRRDTPQVDALARRLNGILGLSTDVYVVGAQLAPEGFDARFSAVWRRYEYRVADAGAARLPLERRSTLWHPARLDVAAMHEAAASLLGLHDWASFCKAREGATSIRTLQEFSWERRDDGVLLAWVRADAFCHSMVRALVGATIAVGEGRLSADRLVGIRELRARTSEFPVVPAKGLVLVEVGYPAASGLADRAILTRARRPSL
jgi:tRNA pseudouridine38-40 synthase